MTKLKLLLLAVCLTSTALNAQTLSGPESIEFDPNDNKYFVGNNTSGTIVKLSANGTLQNYATGIASGPHGLELVADTLYVCDGSNLKMLNRTSGTTIATINLGATFLNGITHKDNNLFITDFSAKKIYRFNMINRSFNIFCSTINSKTPNGIIYDDIDDRLVYCCWGTNAPVHAINLTDSSVTQIGTTTLGNCDGITMNCEGEFYIASWSPNRVTKFTHTISTPTTFIGTGLSSAADIYYNRLQDSLYVPNSGNNTVSKAGDVSCLVSLEDYNSGASNGVFYPNPVKDKIHFKKEDVQESSICVIYNLQGKEVKRAVISEQEMDISDLKSGMYYAVVKSTKTKVYKLIKE